MRPYASPIEHLDELIGLGLRSMLPAEAALSPDVDDDLFSGLANRDTSGMPRRWSTPRWGRS